MLRDQMPTYAAATSLSLGAHTSVRSAFSVRRSECWLSSFTAARTWATSAMSHSFIRSCWLKCFLSPSEVLWAALIQASCRWLPSGDSFDMLKCDVLCVHQSRYRNMSSMTDLTAQPPSHSLLCVSLKVASTKKSQFTKPRAASAVRNVGKSPSP